jgi:hypothetical protein
MGLDPFDSAWLKWAHAVGHTQALEDEIDAFSSDNQREPVLHCRTDYDPKRHGFIVTIEAVEAVPPKWSLLLGDAATNFRAALDHLAWEVALRGRTPPGSGKLTKWQEQAIYFPICEDRRVFNDQIRVPPNGRTRLKLPGIRRADSAKIRRHQPYHTGATRRRFHVLMMLADINSRDRHRTIQPIWAETTEIRLKVTKEWDCKVRHWQGMKPIPKRPLEVDTELAYIPARRTGPDPKVGVKLDVVAEPGIGNYVTFKEWGMQVAMFICVALVEFADPPEELVAPLADLDRFMVNAHAYGRAKLLR